MKKLSVLALAALGFLTLIPNAHAGRGERVIRYYDRCGQPVFGYIYRDSDYGYDRDYAPRYYRPARAYYYNEDNCGQSYRPRYYSRPRVGFSFVFGR